MNSTITPTKRFNAQPLVNMTKQLPYEKNKKIWECHAVAMNFYFCGIKTRSESSLISSDLLFA